MTSTQLGNSRSATISAAVAHMLAWTAFLGIILWPCAYRGESVTPFNPQEAGAAAGEPVQLCASFVEVNGLGVLFPLFIPVLLTAVLLFLALTRIQWRVGSTLILWLVVVALLAFCVLASLSFGVLYLPAALASVVAAILYTPRRLS